MNRPSGRFTARATCVLLASAAITGCKLELIVPPGGQVSTESGAYSCPAGESCTVDITDVFFDETFRAVPDPGYTFVGWRQRPKGFCGGRNIPCRLTTTGFPGTDLMAMLDSDESFYLQPVFAQPETWARIADLPHPGIGAANCVIDGKLYVVATGAHADGKGTPSRTDEYDPATDTWRARATMPKPRNFVTASAVMGKCYVIGGALYPGGEATTWVQAYDPVTNTWQDRAPLPESRAGAGSAVVKGKIYVIGGGDRVADEGADVRQSVVIYDPVSDQWHAGAPMQFPRKGVAVAAIGDNLFAAGGYNVKAGRGPDDIWRPTGTSDVVETYNAATDQWVDVGSMPAALNHATAVVYLDELYILGGIGDEATVSNQVYRHGDTWFTELPTPRWGHSSAVLNRQILVVGGSSTPSTRSALSLTQVYTPAPQPPTPALAFDCNSATPTASTKIDAPTAGYYSGTLYNCAQGGSESVIAWVDESGGFRVFPWGGGGQQLVGSLHAAGNHFQGAGLNFAAQGQRFLSGGATSLWIDGLVAEGETVFEGFSVEGGKNLEGRWGTDWGDYGYFTLGQLIFGGPPTPASWANVAGVWSGVREGFDPPFSGRYDWNIDNDGHLQGRDPTGCDYTGQVGPVDAQYVIYTLDLKVTGCDLAGNYSGLANKTGGPFYDVLHVAVDDGKQRALNLYLLLDL